MVVNCSAIGLLAWTVGVPTAGTINPGEAEAALRRAERGWAFAGPILRRKDLGAAS